jgi:hypothetical protein
MRHAAMALALALGSAGSGLAQELVPPVDVTGRAITLRMVQSRPPDVRGELLAVWHDSVWVLADSPRRIVVVRLGDVMAASVRRHGLTAGRGFLWGILVGTASGVGLSSACGHVSAGCSSVVPASIAIGGALGGLAAISFAISSRWDFEPVHAVDLVPFARFPQGPPPGGFDLLVRPTSQAP